MAKSKIHVGLEIGTSKTCMVVAEVKPDDSLKILAVSENGSAGVRRGEISDYPLARAGVKSALLEAEDLSDVEINSVFLAVTGSHIKGVNNRGTYRLPEEEEEVHIGHVTEATEIARDVSIPSDNVYLHSLIRNYRLDGHDHNVSPVGLHGRTLDVDYHIVHGIRTRIQNSIKCVREIPLEVDDVVFSPIASALVALDREGKDSGALVIDMGGGTTDYVLYHNGSIAASGCIPVGGEHVTNDIHLVTRIPLSEAEKVKKTEGDASGNPAHNVGKIRVTDDKGFTETEIERETLNGIINYRLEETLQLVKNNLPKEELSRVGTGVFLTGGASQMRGFSQLVNSVFDLPVYEADQPDISGVHANFRSPQYATAIGLIRYAQLIDSERQATTGGNKISRFVRTLGRAIWPFG
ncbi:cell division protein FtsA [Persicirhabdus sediminis]|uniref:Cell division protein FtsA n=1 Tax=Persicirhabdus sediminis TaxID=454144 RepID=A0A8J7MIR9_9BACT|nr:cell division protein FtsA [Persicirhabdus sediminis]MBK1791728.1 cell division protein FtsA [Persicirhabdus sediminis]